MPKILFFRRETVARFVTFLLSGEHRTDTLGPVQIRAIIQSVECQGGGTCRFLRAEICSYAIAYIHYIAVLLSRPFLGLETKTETWTK